MKDSPVKIREVWSRNFDHEMGHIDRKLGKYDMVAFDTEFPGFLHNTPRDAHQDLRYDDLRFNVNNLKLIQLGMTLFDEEGKIGGCWQINFSDFDVNVDLCVPESIQLLRDSGMDLEKNRMEGVDSDYFAEVFKMLLSKHSQLRWVSFHGEYDIAYLFKLLTQRQIPSSEVEFVARVGDILGGGFYDVKQMAVFCPGLLGGRLGLERLSKILMVERLGGAHQAGSDCLLTARVFLKMVQVYNLELKKFEGYVYGSNTKIGKQPYPLLVPCFYVPQKYYISPKYYQVIPRPHYAVHRPSLYRLSRPIYIGY